MPKNILQTLTVGLLGELPGPETVAQATFQNTRLKVTLPVYVVSCLRRPTWRTTGYGILFVTDFTPTPASTVANGLANKSLATEYSVDGYKKIGPDRLFLVSIAHNRYHDVQELLRNHIAPSRRGRYDLFDTEKCSVEEEGLFVNLTVLLKVYNNAVEGIYFDHEFLTEKTIERAYHDDAPVARLAARFKRYSFSLLDQRLAEGYFPLMKYYQRGQDSQPEAVAESQAAGLPPHLPPNLPPNLLPDFESSQPKRPRLNASSLVFHRHAAVDDTQRPLEVISSDPDPSVGTQVSRNDSTEHGSLRSPSPSLLTQIPFVPLEARVKRTTLSHLVGLPHTIASIKTNRTYRTSARLAHPHDVSSIVVKPYQRTLKVAPFSLDVVDGGVDLTLELHTDTDLCRFLGVGEVEELYDQLGTITSHLKELSEYSGPLDMAVTRRLMPLHGGHHRAYWTCITPLKELIARH